MKGLINKYIIYVSIKKGKMVFNVEEEDLIIVNMGVLEFELNKILFCVKQSEKIYILCVGEYILFCGVVSMGNLYVVIVVDDICIVVVEILGLFLELYECFFECVNAGFMQVVSCDEINLCVYECGVGEI